MKFSSRVEIRLTRVLITGIAGFVGIHLTRLLAPDLHLDLHGTILPGDATSPGLKIIPKYSVSLHDMDLTDAPQVTEVIQTVDPEIIIHLAAQSNVALSFDRPKLTFDVNVGGSINLLEAVRKQEMDPVVLSIGSAAEYGQVDPAAVPIREEAPLQPASPYSTSKAAMCLLSQMYHRTYGTRAIHTRGFNHFGPHQVDSYVVPSFCKQVAEIEAGRRDPVIKVGNLAPVRDFLDVRDVVRAYWALALHGVPGEVYNVCSGTGHKIEEILSEIAGLADQDISVEVDQDRFRPADLPVLIGSNEKIKKDAGWAPQIPFAQSIRDTLDYWRDEVDYQ